MNRLDLHALIDGELDAKTASQVRAEMQKDPALLNEYNAILYIKQTVSTKLGQVECDEVWVQCRGRIHELERVGKVNGFVGRYGWALCASLFVVIALGGYQHRIGVNSGGDPAKLAKVNAAMSPIPGLRTFMQATHMAREKLGTLVHGADDRLQLMNASQGYINGQPAMRIQFADHIGKMTLYILPNQVAPAAQPVNGTPYQIFTLEEGQALCWPRDDKLMVLVGDRTPAELMNLAKSL